MSDFTGPGAPPHPITQKYQPRYCTESSSATNVMRYNKPYCSYRMFEGPGLLAPAHNIEEAGVGQPAVQAKLVKGRLHGPRDIRQGILVVFSVISKRLGRCVSKPQARHWFHNSQTKPTYLLGFNTTGLAANRRTFPPTHP